MLLNHGYILYSFLLIQPLLILYCSITIIPVSQGMLELAVSLGFH